MRRTPTPRYGMVSRSRARPCFPSPVWPTLHRDLPAIAREHDMVVIDGAARLNELGRAAITASDMVVIPVQASAGTCAPTREPL
jgi:chromosome partitioning protein